MKQVELTLYEVFGYLLPGIFFTGGVGLLFWAFFFPQEAIDFDLKSPEIWIAFLALSYIAGHVTQGLANRFVKRFERAERAMVGPNGLPAVLVDACRKKVQELTGADATNLDGEWLYRVCDEAIVRSGKIGDRDLFTYREGFYRGTFLGMCIFVVGMVAMVVRLWFFSTTGTVHVGTMVYTGWRLVFFVPVFVLAAWILWSRYWRFAGYRVSQAIISALLLDTVKTEKPKDTPKND